MSAPIVERRSVADELRLDAKAFRENTVYTADGNPIRLIANAERMEAGADTITDLLDALERISRSYENQNINHVDFRVNAKNIADAAIAKAKGGAA